MFWNKFVMLCNQHNTTPAAVASDIGLSNAATTKWKHGAVPRDGTIQKIASYFDVSPSVFQQTEIPIDRENKLFDSKNTIITVNYGSGKRQVQSLTKELQDQLKATLSVITVEDPVLVPVYESVSAGFGALARNEVIEHVPCILPSWEADEYIGIKVEGDSMYPKIEDGDTVIVHKQTSVDSGTIAVVLVDGEDGYVKKVEYGPDWINLISINPMYPPIRFKCAEVTRVSVQGRVTKVIKDV